MPQLHPGRDGGDRPSVPTVESHLELQLRVQELEDELRRQRAAPDPQTWRAGALSAHDEMLRYISAWRGRWKQLARETGLSDKWIRRFFAGKIPDPGTSKFETVLRHKQARGGKLPPRTPWTVDQR